MFFGQEDCSSRSRQISEGSRERERKSDGERERERKGEREKGREREGEREREREYESMRRREESGAERVCDGDSERGSQTTNPVLSLGAKRLSSILFPS